jgi:hypothetical protein
MSPQEWGQIPWWEQQAYITGFEKEGILKNDGRSGPISSPGAGQAPKKTIDLTSAGLGELSGFNTRRAG